MAYLPGKNLTHTFSGTAIKDTGSNINRSIGEVDVTNTTSSGAHEFITDITMTETSWSAVVDGAAAPNYAPGTSATQTWAVSSGRSITGTATILTARHSAGPRGAYKIDCTTKYSGTVTES